MKCKVFKILLQDDEFDESKINELLGNVEVREIFASVVSSSESFWSVIVFFDEAGASPKANRNVSLPPVPLSGKSYNIPAAAAIQSKPPVAEPEMLSAGQEKSFAALKAWRNERARLEGLPAYVVAHDELLMQIVVAPIKNADDLLRIRDFGHKRTEIYGDEIIKILVSNA